MSKLDNILGGDNYTKVPWSSTQVNDAGLDRSSVKAMKQDLKDLMLELIGDDDYSERPDGEPYMDDPAYHKREVRAELRNKVNEL